VLKKHFGAVRTLILERFIPLAGYSYYAAARDVAKGACAIWHIAFHNPVLLPKNGIKTA
jgi:hypothetical protein